MRPTVVIVLFLLALCVPASALAGTFTVPFGAGAPMLSSGWAPRPDAGPVCGYEGDGTVFLNAGTLAAHSGCLYLFNAPGQAQILAVNTTFGYAKASSATGLCAYSFAAQPGDTLRRCSGGTYASAVATSGANWVELGLYNEGGTPVAISTPRANNVVFSSGWVTLADPTAPGLSAVGPTGVQSGLSAQIQWQASDPESGAPSVAYAIDGGTRVGLRGQACSWLCGTGAGGSSAIDLAPLGDGPHSLTVYAQSYADAGASAGPIAFTVDRTPPAQPRIHVERDASAPAGGWWGHAPIALSVSSATAADVVSSELRVFGPTGAVTYDRTSAGALTTAAIPASALDANGAYETDVLECDAAGHCTASSRAGFQWDGAAPPAGADAIASPLGALAAREGGHLTWPALAAETGVSGVAGAFLGIGPTAEAARTQALDASRWEAGVPGVSEAAIPGSLVHAAERVCLATRLLSGAGIAAASAAVRCASVDEVPPEVALRGGVTWSGGPQTVVLTADDPNGADFSEVLLDGASVHPDGGVLTISDEGMHRLRAVARDAAGNETVAERSLGVDASPPVIGDIRADFQAREVRVEVADGLAGVKLVEVRLAGTALETRLAADGRTAVARVPAGRTLDGAAVDVRVIDAASPGNMSRRAVILPARTLPVLRDLTTSGGGVTGLVIAPAPARVQIWAYPKGRAAHAVGIYPTRPDGTFAVRVRPLRTTRYAVAVPESDALLELPARTAGTVRVTAHIRALRLRLRRAHLVVRAQFEGRGEATRLHLLVHDVVGGRWVEGCLSHGRPGVHLERTGRVWGSCRIPPSARGRAWTYRLVLAAPSSTWPWRTPSSASRSVLLPL